MKIAICIATTGRPAILNEALSDIFRQSRRPDSVYVCPIKPEDIDAAFIASCELDVKVVYGSAGLAAQRNTLLNIANLNDIILFIDDDFLLAPDYVEEMDRLFKRETTCVVATGEVIADGIKGSGIPADIGRSLIAKAPYNKSQEVVPVFGAYGCNMAIRWAALRETNCLFDEQLPLYAWAEDVDFSRQASRHGSVLRSCAMRGVHLGTKAGRISGVRFGYSQIANQIYLVRKGTIPLVPATRKAFENLFANVLGCIQNRDPHVDRRGRMIGNMIAFGDLITGRISPMRILSM